MIFLFLLFFNIFILFFLFSYFLIYFSLFFFFLFSFFFFWPVAGLGHGRRPVNEGRRLAKRKRKKKCFSKLFLETRNNFFYFLILFQICSLGTKILPNTFLFFFCSPKQKNRNFCSG